MEEIPTKRCSRCRQIKPVVEFGNDKSRRDGKHPQCKVCARESQRRSLAKPAVRERQRVYQREWARQPRVRERNLAYQKTEVGKLVKRRAKLKAKYNMTLEQYKEMLAQQGNVCAVCHRPFISKKRTHVDHCHSTGVVRGILCGDCNRALGAVRDDPEVLSRLIRYLEAANASSDN